MIDNATSRDLDRVVAKTLSDAGLTQPPIHRGSGTVSCANPHL